MPTYWRDNRLAQHSLPMRTRARADNLLLLLLHAKPLLAVTQPSTASVLAAL